MDKSRNSGFTLIELVLVITLTGILSAMAYPSFASTIKSLRISTASNLFLSTLNLARCEAIKRNLPIVVAKIDPNSNVWEKGWFVYVDVDKNNSYEGDSNWSTCPKDTTNQLIKDCVIATFDPLNKDIQLNSLNVDSSQNYVTFANDGSLQNNTTINFKLASSDTSIKEYRTIAINLIGHSLVTKFAS